jgi:hypothetical protein
MPVQRGSAFGIIILSALLFFELFNYSTTEFALRDLLGELDFVGIRWATILSIAFCGIDFAGIARIFTPETGENEPKEVWYLLGAWLLAATMNAMLTWWGVSIAILNNESLGNSVIPRESMLTAVPIFVATLVWLSRVLLIGTFSIAGERLVRQKALRPIGVPRPPQRKFNPGRPKAAPRIPASRPAVPAFRPAPKPKRASAANGPMPPEPTYHPVSLNGRQANSPGRQTRR